MYAGISLFFMCTADNFMHNSILTCYALCVLGGCVDAAEGCGHICMPEKRMCVCASACGREAKTILAIQPFLFNEEWKTGIQRCGQVSHINVGSPDSLPLFKKEWHRSEARIDQPRGRINSRGTLSSLNPQMGHKEFLGGTSCSLTRRKAGPTEDAMFGCFQKDSQSPQIVQ